MPTTDTANNAQSQQTQVIKPDFGEGRYSPLMEECFKDAKVIFGLPADKAEKLARNIANEFGAYMSSQTIGLNSIKLGKVNKDNKMTLAEAASKVKGVTQTYALLALRALKFANEAMANGFSRSDTAWAVNEHLQQYFDKKL